MQSQRDWSSLYTDMVPGWNSCNIENVLLLYGGNCLHDTRTELKMHADARHRMLRLGLHAHSHAELFVVLEGTLTLSTQEHTLILGPHDMAIVAAQFPHRADTQQAGVHVWANVLFTIDPTKSSATIDLYGFLHQLMQDTPCYVQKNSACAYKAMIRMLTHVRSGRIQLNGACMYEIFLDILDYNRKRNLYLPPLVTDNDNHRLALIDGTIRNRYMEPVSITELAARLSLSRRQLERFIQKHYGMSLTALITQKRMEAAKQLLSAVDHKTVNEIAAEVGYETAGCFYKAFKNATGLTPAQFRRQLGGIPEISE